MNLLLGAAVGVGFYMGWLYVGERYGIATVAAAVILVSLGLWGIG
jgi:hypothetical protein